MDDADNSDADPNDTHCKLNMCIYTGIACI